MLRPSLPGRPRMRRYMKVRAARRFLSEELSGLVRLAYPGRFDRHRHTVIIPESSLSPWRFDANFRNMHRKIGRFSLVDEMRPPVRSLATHWRTSRVGTEATSSRRVNMARAAADASSPRRATRRAAMPAHLSLRHLQGWGQGGRRRSDLFGGEHMTLHPELVRSLAGISLWYENIEILTGNLSGGD